jgi:hypothetical protein
MAFGNGFFMMGAGGILTRKPFVYGDLATTAHLYMINNVLKVKYTRGHR